MIYATLVYNSDYEGSYSHYIFKSDLPKDEFKELLAKAEDVADELMSNDIDLDVWDAYDEAFDLLGIKQIDNLLDNVFTIDICSGYVE